MNHKNAKKISICTAILLQSSAGLYMRQWRLNPKEIKGQSVHFDQIRDQKGPVCASSFAKNGHEPL